MVQLLTDRKRELLAAGKPLTPREFEQAWRDAWATMTAERAWAHATEHRRGSRTAMLATRSEYRAAFLDQPTGFSTLASALTVAAQRLNVQVTTADLPTLMIGAIRQGYLADDPVPTTTEHRGGVAA